MVFYGSKPALRGSGCFAPLILPLLLRPYLLRMQPRIAAVFATPRAEQLALAALELAAALHTPQLRRLCPSGGVDAFSVLLTPRTRRRARAAAAPGTQPGRRSELLTERRKRQRPLADGAPLLGLPPRPDEPGINPQPRIPPVLCECVSLAKTCGGETRSRRCGSRVPLGTHAKKPAVRCVGE